MGLSLWLSGGSVATVVVVVVVVVAVGTAAGVRLRVAQPAPVQMPESRGHSSRCRSQGHCW